MCEVVAQSLKFLFLTLGFVACGSLGLKTHRTPVQTGWEGVNDEGKILLKWAWYIPHKIQVWDIYHSLPTFAIEN